MLAALKNTWQELHKGRSEWYLRINGVIKDISLLFSCQVNYSDLLLDISEQWFICLATKWGAYLKNENSKVTHQDQCEAVPQLKWWFTADIQSYN